MLQHYFMTAWLPKDKQQREYYAKRLAENRYFAGVMVGWVSSSREKRPP